MCHHPKQSYFNPQVPCGTRHEKDPVFVLSDQFQSTGPLRDPTLCSASLLRPRKFQSTGPLRDPTLALGYGGGVGAIFQSTGPLRDPTITGDLSELNTSISIHRSLAGPDCWQTYSLEQVNDFNPQVPCGTRPDRDQHRQEIMADFNPQVPCGTRRRRTSRLNRQSIFQSTGPLRDPTPLSH